MFRPVCSRADLLDHLMLRVLLPREYFTKTAWIVITVAIRSIQRAVAVFCKYYLVEYLSTLGVGVGLLYESELYTDKALHASILMSEFNIFLQIKVNTVCNYNL